MEHHASVKSYSLGFVISVILTLISYAVVVFAKLPSGIVLITILVLAFAQLFVQLVFFLHLGRENGPKWNLIFFLSTASIIFLVVVGSLWIMNHLEYNHEALENAGEVMMHEEGIHK